MPLILSRFEMLEQIDLNFEVLACKLAAIYFMIKLGIQRIINLERSYLAISIILLVKILWRSPLFEINHQVGNLIFKEVLCMAS